jgi:AGZA family xanthine/uracil permease-like MFS transporter
MAYILFVNPSILSAAGIDAPSAVACTALASAICCFLMGFIADFPLATAPGMGLNAFVAFTLAAKAGSWQAAMGVIFLDGLIMLILVLAGLREAIMDAIPRDLRLATGAGIGLFIALLGLVNAKIVILGIPDAPLQPGSVTNPTTIVSLIGLIITATLMARRITGAIVIGILAATLAALALHVTHLPTTFQGPHFSTAFHADIRGALHWQLLPYLFAVLMVDFFDTLGTATAIGEQANLVEPNGRVKNIRQILIVDSLAASIGGLLGVSSVTAYIESAAGVAEGARTGLHSIFVGLFFLLAIFAAPLASIVPSAATAPALILVGFLMISQLTKINFTDIESAIPAFIILITIPLTYSIAHGIGYGFIAYTLIKLLVGKPKQVRPLMYLVAAAFTAYFIAKGHFAH